MKLQELLRDHPEVDVSGLPDLKIEALTADSCTVTPGSLFFAIRGVDLDGHQFIHDAILNGAQVVIGESPIRDLPVPYIQVSNSRWTLGVLASAWHGHPSQNLVLIGVTGTDGKTTTANILYHLLQTAGINTGMITSVNARIGEKELDTGFHVTTPDPLELQAFLASMVKARLTHCILETTSHGLAQHRVSGCVFDIGVVTNITHEHLDFHGSYEEYREAKGLLFANLSKGKSKPFFKERSSVLNRDDSSFPYLEEITESKTYSYGITSDADFTVQDVESGPDGMKFTLLGSDFQLPISTRLIGEFNVSNVLAGYSAAIGSMGLDPANLDQALQDFAGVPGRMERIELGQDFAAIVDFAHTPNALDQALQTARKLTDGRLIAVFGSAGLRDRAKRGMMAEISAEIADLTVFTAEDPRTEALVSILAEMAEGAMARGGVEGTSFVRVPDRGEAIRYAIAQANLGDLVIVCGKGHEQSMCFGEIEYPWDDRLAVRAALSDLLGIDGPMMPSLPTGIAPS